MNKERLARIGSYEGAGVPSQAGFVIIFIYSAITNYETENFVHDDKCPGTYETSQAESCDLE